MPRFDNFLQRLIPAIIFFLLILCAGCGSEPAHTLGDVWAMAYPTRIAFNTADHTYLRGLDDQGRSHIWMCFGESTDGEELAGTRSDGQADLTVVDFMASQAPCKWPLSKYLIVGVCHQCANRGLYYTGTTVSAARGYNFFAGIYGTYGEDQSGEYSMENCLAAAPAWQGADYLSAATADQAEEIHLAADYHESYEREISSARPSTASRRTHLDALLAMKVRRHLGAGFPEDVLAALQAARNRCLDDKRALDSRTAADDAEPSAVIRDYERLFNDLADRYKKLLSPDEYEALFNLPYDEPIDLARLIPPA